jgi:hypothetical protein
LLAEREAPEDLVVALGEKEIVEIILEQGSLRIEHGRSEVTFPVLVVVHQSFGNRFGVGIVADLPDFGNVLQCGDETLARRRVVDRRDPRSLVAGGVERRDDLHQREVFGVEQDQAVRQVVGNHHPLAVTGNGSVARVQAGADFGDDDQVVDVELGDPAVARSEIDKAAIGRELRAAVQCVAAGEAVQAFELVAVEHRHVMVAGFDDDEQIQRVGAFQPRTGLVG